MADQDGSGFIDDKELQGVLSSYNQSFSLRTVHLLMYLFTNTNARKIGTLSLLIYISKFSFGKLINTKLILIPYDLLLDMNLMHVRRFANT